MNPLVSLLPLLNQSSAQTLTHSVTVFNFRVKKKKTQRGSMVTAQMRGEGGECDRLIMWLALGPRGRMKRTRRTQTEAGREGMRKHKRNREDMNSVSITPLSFTLQRRPGPSDRVTRRRRRWKTPAPTINGRGKQPCQFVTWLAAATRSSALLHAANCLLTSPQGDEVRSVCGCAGTQYVCVG